VILLPLLTFIIIFNIWYREGKDLLPGTVSVKYKPDDIDIMINTMRNAIIYQGMPFFLNPTKLIKSIIFDFARLGYLSVKEVRSDKFPFFKTKDYKIKILKKLKNIEDDPEYLRVIFKELKTTFIIIYGKPLYGLEILFSKVIEDKKVCKYYANWVKYYLYRVLEKRRIFYGNPLEVITKYSGLAFLLLIIGIIIMLNSPYNWRIGFGILLSGVIILIFAPLMPKRTYKGRKILKDALAYKEFYDRVEKEKELKTGGFKSHGRVEKSTETPKKENSSDGENV
jgi:hypothetical protein